MGSLDGKVALISGVARGQGRSHAVKLAEQGADIIGFDICADIPEVEAPLASPDDLEETVRLVEKAGRSIRVSVQDVRDADGVAGVIDEGVAAFGRLDIVLANAGIMPITGEQRLERNAWLAGVDIMLHGVYNTVTSAIPHLRAHGEGGSIVITSSTAGIKGMGVMDPGMMGYIASKHAVVGLMRVWANNLAAERIRVNTVHPTGVNTPMVANETFGRFVMEHPALAENLQNPFPIETGLVEPEDISNQILHLVGETGRYITGSTVMVDAGFTNRM